MNRNQKFNELPICEVLGGFRKEDRNLLASYGEFLKYNSGETVIEEQVNQDALYLVLRGRLRAMHRKEDRAVTVGTIDRGEWFGEVNIFDPRTASTTVTAQEDSYVWRIPRPKLEEFLNVSPHLGCQLLLGIAGVLACRVRRLVAKVNTTWEMSWNTL